MNISVWLSEASQECSWERNCVGFDVLEKKIFLMVVLNTIYAN